MFGINLTTVFAVVATAVVVVVVPKVFTWVKTKIVTPAESDISTLKADVAALKKKVGI